MAPSSPPTRLDAAVDAHVREATDVTSRADWSRRRTLARLSEPERRRTAARPVAWVAAATALATIVVVAWLAHGHDPASRSLLVAHPSGAGASVLPPRIVTGHPLAPVPGELPLAKAPRRARGRVAATLAAADDQENALGPVIRAVRQLPPEVWDRVEHAGPPMPLPEIDIREMSTAPLSIDPLPGGDWSSIPSSLSGGPR